MTLEESVQHVVMEAIQEVGEGIPCGSPEVAGEGTLGNWAQPLLCLVRSGLCHMSAVSQNPVASEALAFFCTGGSL